MKTTKQFIKYLLSLMILLKYSILKRSNFELNKVKIDCHSRIKFDAKSSINIKKLKLVNSTLIIVNSIVNIDDLRIVNSFILIENSKITIGTTSEICDYNIHWADSIFTSKRYLNITKGHANIASFSSEKGSIIFGENVNIHACIAIRNGNLCIGDNVFINQNSELRCEKSITIGDYVMISTDCIIYDTNTHSINHLDRRQEIKNGFPNNVVSDKKILDNIMRKAIVIGNDVWIGKRVAIMKGSNIEDNCIIALGAIVTGFIPINSIAKGNPYSVSVNSSYKIQL